MVLSGDNWTYYSSSVNALKVERSYKMQLLLLGILVSTGIVMDIIFEFSS